MRHHTIVVSSWKDELIEKAHEIAQSIFSWVSPISPTRVNGYRAFFIPPDGSKEGWGESDKGDKERGEFIKFLRSEKYDDGSTSLDWVEVQFGDDAGETIIISHSDEESIKP